MKRNVIIIVVVALVAGLAFWLAGKYNAMVTAEENVTTAWSQVENQYQRRSDLIPNLVATVKGYAEHEEKTLVELTEARTKAMASQTTQQRVEAEQGFQSALSRLLAIAENYPDLKANQNFLQLQQELRTQEDNIANSRKYYNAVVREFNTKIEKMPGALFAGMFGFVKQTLFEIPDVAQRENVNVQF